MTQGENKYLNNEEIEIKLLLEAIYLKYGYDFRGYSKNHIKRRIKKILTESGLDSISIIQHKILSDKIFFEKVFPSFSINVTEMFRDPSFFVALRKEVIPVLRTYPHIKIWHAGCSSGEEVYSMAIILKEEGLYNKTQIYATDINENVLKKAREGIYHIDLIKKYTLNYNKAEGTASFYDYYRANYDGAILDKSLRENIIFTEHNLVTDGAFGEMNLIICRNVLIYFIRDLQNRVIKLFSDSLCKGGFLCLGSKETLQFSEWVDMFDPFIESEKIYKGKLK